MVFFYDYLKNIIKVHINNIEKSVTAIQNQTKCVKHIKMICILLAKI